MEKLLQPLFNHSPLPCLRGEGVASVIRLSPVKKAQFKHTAVNCQVNFQIMLIMHKERKGTPHPPPHVLWSARLTTSTSQSSPQQPSEYSRADIERTVSRDEG